MRGSAVVVFKRLVSVLSASIVVAGSAAGCGGAAASDLFKNTPKCGDPEFECPPSPNHESSKAVFHCDLHVEDNIKAIGVTGTAGVHDVTGDVPTCLPAALNRYIGNPAAVDAIGDYPSAVLAYGNQTLLPQFAALKGIDSGGSQCSILLGVEADPKTICQLVSLTRSPFCEDPTNFVPTVCTTQDCHFKMSAMIDPHACACNTVEESAADCHEPTETIVIPPPGSDPPGNISGLLARQLAAANRVVFDPATSMATFTVSFTDHLGFTRSDSENSTISGSATLFGRRRSDGTSDMLFEMNIALSDVTLTFKTVDAVKDVSVKLTRMVAEANLGSAYLHLDANGVGILPANSLALDFEGFTDSQKVILQNTNALPVVVLVDFASKTFKIPSFKATAPDTDVTIALSGTIVNQPPMVDAGASQSVECTSASATSVTLHGTATDPDQIGLAVSWHRGDFLGDLVSTDLQPTVSLPFAPPASGATFEIHATDTSLQTAAATTTVTIRDTTPPIVSVNVDPTCLWAPNHKMVLYQLGADLQATATDTCDPQPKLSVAGVTSDQPVSGGGSGDATQT